jgi:hypothetical protein
MYITRAGFEIKLHQWAQVDQSLARAAVQRDLLGAQRPILDISILYTTAAKLEEQGRLVPARDFYARAVSEAHAKLPSGAKNVGLAETKLAAFETRHGTLPAR